MLDIKIVSSPSLDSALMEELCREVTSENDIDARIEIIAEVGQLDQFGVLVSPTLIVNDQILISGRLPKKHTLTCWLLDLENQDAMHLGQRGGLLTAR